MNLAAATAVHHVGHEDLVMDMPHGIGRHAIAASYVFRQSRHSHVGPAADKLRQRTGRKRLSTMGRSHNRTGLRAIQLLVLGLGRPTDTT